MGLRKERKKPLRSAQMWKPMSGRCGGVVRAGSLSLSIENAK